ncbi:hypothetical protein FOA43_001642 [Brettanomyces nanus]|uniref:Probable transporter MCH1 n=1 Tax=Eeniella nana TaxID=13502 RepID=A0A875S1V9_EENNA|nr:uncharacterized protein FOA43_001642 [Brettanomyces nanus]QPG74315.1 hypothetical protein FOA43_001642 [Brettanomyces nanus]
MVERLSAVENALTYKIRRFLTAHFSSSSIRRGSFISALITCLADASVVTFSIFTPMFIEKLNYDQIDINIIGGGMNVGLYLTLPALGYLSDAHGPILLALIGMVLCPGYLFAAWCYMSNSNSAFMAFSFFLIGIGTSSAYFCSLLTCAKIYPDKKGLSISLPVTCYGLSSLLLSYVFKLPVFRETIGKDISIISTYRVFIFLSVAYLITGFLNSISSVIVTIEKEVVFTKLAEQEEQVQDDESQLEAAARVQSYNSVDNTSLINSEFMEPQTHQVRFRRFLKDPTMPLLYVVVFFLIGTQELFISNLGSLTKVVGYSHRDDISEQVALFSVFSTLARLGAGFLNDFFGTYKSTVRLTVVSILMTILAYILIAINFRDFAVISSLMGLCYGSTYTLFPTLVATVWGVDLMGSTWGLFLSAPAIGSLVFGLFYAYQFDSYCEIQSKTALTYCLTFPFTLFASLCVVSAISLFYCYRRYWISSLEI